VGTTVGEVLVWLFFFALLVPAGFTGWAIGHYTAGAKNVTRTVTVAARASATTAATTTAAAPTTTAATTTAATTTAATTAKAAAGGGNAAKGKSVFAANGCGACHTFKPAGSTASIGPDLDSKPSADAKKDKMELAAFVHESIVSPNAYISPGYSKGVMPPDFGTKLTKSQLADLVAFIVAGAH
jgi:mono/diheme cytochrome c family protein